MVTAPVVEEDLPPVIENIEVEKLTGPKILGKIELPVDNDTCPVKDEKKQRKRIPIAKKDTKREIFINKDADKKPGPGRSGRSPHTRKTAEIHAVREDKLIDEKEIQEKIRETGQTGWCRWSKESESQTPQRKKTGSSRCNGRCSR